MMLPNNFILIRRNVKHARIRVSEDNFVRVIVPLTFTNKDVNMLIAKKEEWINKQLNYFKGMSKITTNKKQILLFGNRYTYLFDSSLGKKIILNYKLRTISSRLNLLDIAIQEGWYKNIAKTYFIRRTSELSASLNLKFNRLYIRSPKNKWGNCSNKKNISLNWRLVKAPKFVIDYIIIHELVHTILMNHTLKFWSMLKSYYPNYKESIKWLDIYGNSL